MFIDKICARVTQTSPIVLGIDPNRAFFPEILGKKLGPEGLFLFSQVAIDALGELVCGVKFQSAYFEAFGSAGIASLAKSIRYAKNADLPVILDVKRADIGSTAQAYANAYLGADPADEHGCSSDLQADGITVNPYLGPDSLAPFVDRAAVYQKGLFILTKTSNPGSGFIQDKICEGQAVFTHVARFIDEISRRPEHVGRSGLSNIGAVVGASYPSEAKVLRRLMPRALFLVPGLGSQGGDWHKIAPAVLDHNGEGAIFPISRELTYFAEEPSSFGAYQELMKRRLKKYMEPTSRVELLTY